MPWFRNNPADDSASTPQAPQPWWAEPSGAPGAPPLEPDFDAIVAGQRTASGELPAAPPAAAPAPPPAVAPGPSPAVEPAASLAVEPPAPPVAEAETETTPDRTAPERRTVLGGLRTDDALTAPPAVDDVALPTDLEDPAYDDEPILPSQPEQEIPVPVARIEVGFGERIERLIAAAMTEAENTRADAQHEAAQLVQSAQLDAEHAIAAAQRKSAEIVAATQRRCDDELAAAQRTREEAEQVLAEARDEAEQLRRRVRDEVAQMRAEVDEHTQAMLARTHADTNRSLASARAELEEIALRKAELEEQMASLRALLSEAVVEPLPPDVSGFLGQPPVASPSPDPEQPSA